MRAIISLLLLLTVVKLIHCQDHEQMIVLTLQGILQNLTSINGQLKGHDELLQRIPDMQQKFQHLENNLQDMQEKLEHLENNLQDVHQELGNQKTSFQELHHELEHVKGLSQETGQLVRREVLEHLTNVSAAANEEIKSYVHEEISGVISLAQDMQEKLQHLENNLQDVQQEQGNQKTYFQELHHELEHVKGLSQETAQCLKGEDLEHLTNVSAAANQEIKSFVHEEISGVISLAQKDECLEGGLPCGDIGTCENTLFSFTCSCPSGFTWDGSECKDVDECAEGKDECVPNAKCKNSIGSYSCSCNKHFKGDGRTSCEFQCRSPAKRVPGLGCLMLIKQWLTFQAMKKTCEEEGGRLAQHMSLQQLEDMVGSFGFTTVWVGVYDGKWTSDGSLVPEDLWKEGYESDPSRRCGYIVRDSSSSSYKLNQWDCSETFYGYCQFPMP
ncbi:uncharacterized protein [Palaemon carinicauda]|uniref:uncharacterized protein n=1 Tax=Palaemon carinicauda TaxID=392227 RepID=UPI0035B5F79F